jgi:hypothetical protein
VPGGLGAEPWSSDLCPRVNQPGSGSGHAFERLASEPSAWWREPLVVDPSTGGRARGQDVPMEPGDNVRPTEFAEAPEAETPPISGPIVEVLVDPLGDQSAEFRPQPAAPADAADHPPPPRNAEATDAPGRPEGTDAAGDGRPGESAAGRELDRVLERLGEVERLVDELRADLANRAIRESAQEQALSEEKATAAEVRQEIGELRETVIGLGQKGTGQDPTLAAEAAAQQAVVVSDVRDARKRFPTTATWSRIWQALKRVAPHLWVLIARLARVTEWSVTGQVGGGVLGLASAGITVTFG